MVTTQNYTDELSSQQMALLTTQSSYQGQTRWVIPVSFTEPHAPFSVIYLQAKLTHSYRAILYSDAATLPF